MSAPLTEMSLRRPAPADAEAVLALIKANEVLEYGEPDTDLEELRQEWSQVDLSEDAWLATDSMDRPLGYAAVYPGKPGFRFDVYADPGAAPAGLRNNLLALCEARACAQLVDEQNPAAARARAFATQANPADCRALEAAGFRPIRYHFRMQIDMGAAPDPAIWPDGCTLRTIVPGQDDRRVFEFVKIAFGRQGWLPVGFEEWRAFMMREDHFESDLWYLLTLDQELIGAALCFDYPLYGWIRQLAVAAAWRRRGIGTALLRHAFGEFYRRNQRRVALGMHADNEGAYAFYERAGMRRVRQYDEYQKEFMCGAK